MFTEIAVAKSLKSFVGSLTPTKIAIITVCAVVGALAIANRVEARTIATLRAQMATSALEASNARAIADSTMNLSARNASVAKALGDSLTLYHRLVVQTAQHGDAVDQALTLERRGRYALSVQLDSLHQAIASRAGVTDTTERVGGRDLDVRRASFDVRQPPYTATLAVELPPAPDTARLDLRIALDPIPVVARLSCAAPDPHGIRAASIEASTPKWAAVQFTDVQQSPDLCSSPALQQGTQASGRSILKWKPVIIGVGYVAQNDSHRGVGVFVGTGWAFASR